uniref:Uncharacterized protein n=1 Tax=Lotharella oceanica TaxID=641309 RepID=A0A7S2XBM1_9EUKA|mmetsp:Transcript_26409/g.49356  ORF Transcript_26409/g.49356 Transcript_26409/m.49356 type:complete len:767 (+) Transcript_26409:64-2364(+)
MAFSTEKLLRGLDTARGFVYNSLPSLRSTDAAEKLGGSLDDFGDILALNDKILQETSDDLSDEDVKKYDLDPPRVIVVGLTSAGKSSLLERIIGFPIFPVLDKVCTRQPFQLSMQRASDPQKKVKTTNKSPRPSSSPDQKHNAVQTEDEMPHAELKFPATGKTFQLPEDTPKVRDEIASLQGSKSEHVHFSKDEIRATVKSTINETFTFTDLPGVFMVGERKMGSNYAQSRAENTRLQNETMAIAKHYVQKPNTIVLVVISATDWMHGLNNDPLCGHLCEWLEETRKNQSVDVYGVITKLDTQKELSKNSPLRKVLTGQLSEDHILQGLKVKKWIPVVSSPAVLSETNRSKAESIELEAIHQCLKSCIPSSALEQMPLGRTALLRELKFALLKAIIKTQKGLRDRIGSFSLDVENKLKALPRPASVPEKRVKFDNRLKVLEETLKSEVGQKGTTATNSLRMQLLVHAPAKFQEDLLACSLRGDVQKEVQQIMNQAALEAGGSFDSDMSFNTLSRRIIESYRTPCLKLVESCAQIVLRALKKSVDKAFGDYKQLKLLVHRTLGLQAGVEVKAKSSSLDGALDKMAKDGKLSMPGENMFGILQRSAVSKVLSLLDAHRTMICFHPMWRNFDTLHTKILLGPPPHSRDAKNKDAEDTLQRMLELPALAKRVREEGRNAIRVYEQATGETVKEPHRAKILKHFARVEVMGYIIRMSLVGCIFPIIIRDLRDGLFQGIHCGMSKFEFSVSSLLRCARFNHQFLLFACLFLS